MSKGKRGRGALLDAPCPMLPQPDGLTDAAKLFCRAVKRSGLSLPAFGKAIGFTGKRKSIGTLVGNKCRGRSKVTKTDINLVKLYSNTREIDLLSGPIEGYERARVKRGADGRRKPTTKGKP